MKTILGVIGILASIVVGLYVGVWLMFVGGIIGVAKVALALFAGKLLAGTLALSVIKIVFSAFAGWIAFAVLFLPSYAMVVGN